MKTKFSTRSARARRSFTEGGFINLRSLLGLTLCFSGVALAIFAGRDGALRRASQPERYMPVPGASSQDEAARLAHLEQYWRDRLTFPTGRFNPAWVRAAAAQHARMPSGVPAGLYLKLNPANPLRLTLNNFTALGPQPERMTGCSGCYNYTTTEGRVNAIAVDPTTTINGSIVAYSGAVGGGVWKTTNCCSGSTTWTVVTDDPLISTTAIDTLVIDPSNHNTVYAGTGDLNFGSFSMGSQGILKSTDAGATWTVLGANVFGMAYVEPSGQFPQYNAVGKVRVDPNNSNKVVAGTKQGVYFSYDGGVNWTGPCFTNNFSTQRQDVTGLELSDMGGGNTRIIAGIGTRGFATTVQYDLGNNGANGLYSATMGSSGCPSFSSIASNANGFIFGNQVTGSPYTTGAPMNAGSGSPFVDINTGNQLGRIDIAVAPSNSNYIYAQVQSIVGNNNGGCGNSPGCQIGAWATTDGGTSWSYMEGSQGGALRDCQNGAGDYPQNWYDQGVAVDPNNPDRVFFDTFEVWFATRTGNVWNDTTCGYSYSGSAGPVHVDQHALAFLPGSSSILLIGNDGGTHGTINADVVNQTQDPTWFNMDTDINTIEFYSGDISGNFANAASPEASGGAQDNGSSSVTFTGAPTGPVLWQLGVGGDGFYSRIDPVGTGTSLRFWQGNNSGMLHRCVSNCTAQNAPWSGNVSGGSGSWSGDTRSFILPYDLFHGGIPGGDDCPPAGVPGGCGHLIAATTRVWETILGGNSGFTSSNWYITNNPINQNMTKQTLGNRSFINQVKYSPKYQSVAMVGTNDANVWIGFNLGTGTQSQANWVDVTGNNTVVPLRPVLGIALDPTVSAVNLPVGYAAVGGFNANTPGTPGHVFQVTCAADCGSFTWANKTGNLPDIPVDSIMVNPNNAQQVFAGTDWGVYYTDDITVASPTWQRFENGIPHAMVWDMQIDRGATTLSVWTRSRGAYVFPLPGGGGTPTPTPTASPSATPTSTPTPTPTPTATPCDSGIIQNEGFETGSFPPWVIDGHVNDPVVATNFAHTGTHSAFAGGNPQQNTYCEENNNEPLGDSSFYQQFAVPAGTSTLSFWHMDCTNDSITFDWQDAYITDSNGNILQTIYHLCDTADWTNEVVDMSSYAGQTVRIKFLVHQDGFNPPGDTTGQWVDDVVLYQPCGTPSPTPTATPTPTPTARPTPTPRPRPSPRPRPDSLELRVH